MNTDFVHEAKFERLSSLVLIDTLSALPTERVVRVARLGSERLRSTCSLKWVKDRMTDVTFENVLRAHQMSRELADTFCTSSVMRRLNGKVVIPCISLESERSFNLCTQLPRQVSGKLYISLQSSTKVSNIVARNA